MKPKNFLFAISIGLLLFMGCGKDVDQTDCAGLVDSLALSMKAKIDSVSQQVQTLAEINASGKVAITLLRDSLRLAEAERIRLGKLLDQNVFHEPPIKF